MGNEGGSYLLMAGPENSDELREILLSMQKTDLEENAVNCI